MVWITSAVDEAAERTVRVTPDKAAAAGEQSERPTMQASKATVQARNGQTVLVWSGKDVCGTAKLAVRGI